MFGVLSKVKKRDIYSLLFKRGQYEQFCTIKENDIVKVHKKQLEVLKLLTDSENIEICYGGAAGGGKSWIGCTWLLFMSLNYPNTRWFIGREELKRLRESTLQTFFKVCTAYGIAEVEDFKYNGQDHYIQFTNGSRIDLLDLKYLPSDPLFERYGSVEYTGGWVEEGAETEFAAYDTLKTRVGRQKNKDYGLLRKIFVTCNPKKNWLYYEFYKPFVENRLDKAKKFIQAFYFDNPFLDSGYGDALSSIKDKAKRDRLKDGNWEYEENKNVLCSYDAILDVFDMTKGEVQPSGKRYISADLAMQGRDKFVAGVWEGLVCTVAIDQEKANGRSIEADLKRLMMIHKIVPSRTISDSDGLGAYLESYLNGIKEFHGGASAINKKEYVNLKSECAYKLAELINDRKIKIICSESQRSFILEELGLLIEANLDDDEKKKRIIKKEEMKSYLQGRSPDYLDMLIMRMYFELVKERVKVYSI